jgi:glycerol-3-phosphate dehydrogenase
MLLLGTTDTLYEDDPDKLEATEEDVRQVLGEAAAALDADLVRREAVRSTFAGLRVLPDTRSATARTRRETMLLVGPAGMLTIAGGKLTTYRRIALEALGALRPDLDLHRLDPEPAPLPGAADLRAAAERIATSHPQLEPHTRLHLAHLYGALADEVLAGSDEDPSLLQPLHPDGPDIAAQVGYARTREWACTAEDVFRRRTTLALRGLAPTDAERLTA